MKNNNFQTKSKSRLIGILLLTLVFLLSLCCSFACSCNDEDEDEIDYDPDFTFSDIVEDESVLVSNPNFSLGLADKDKDDYPVSSISGWSVSTDTGAVSSAVTSGVINTTDDMWKATVTELVDSDVFLAWAKANYSFTPAENATDEEIATALIAAGYTSPATHTDAKDSNVLMINNFTNNDTYAENLGTAQSARSTSTINIAKGKAVKITFYAYTDKISSLGTEFGANARVTTTINSVTQAEYAIKDIKTSGAWVQYTLYVRGNDNVETSVSLSFGLGFYSLAKTQLVTGSAFFDNIEVEELTAKEYDIEQTGKTQLFSSLSATTFSGNPESYRESASGSARQLFFYNLSDKIDSYVKGDLDPAEFDYTNYTYGDATVSLYNDFANGIDANKLGSFSNDVITVNKQVAGAQVGGEFTVDAKSYVIVRFTIKNNLSKYYGEGVKIYLLDINGTTGDVIGKSSALATENYVDADDDEIGDETVYTITVTNSFPSTNTDVRKFKILVIVGPANPAEQANSTFFPSGSVEVKDASYIKAPIDANDTLEDNVQYSFINSLSNGTYSNFLKYSLYAGNDAVYSEKDDTETYNVTISGINKHNIATGIVNASQYTGVVADHRMVKENGVETAVNTSATAGVVNSKYTYSAIPSLDFGTLEKDDDGNDINIQPLVIYNPSATAYGFIGNKQVLNANSTAKITLKVKVDATAKAYIYIVNMDNELNVLTHTVGSTTNYLAIEVGNTAGEWVDVTFNIASGDTALNYRVELWNGTRNGATETASEGIVMFNEISYGTFTEPSTVNSAILQGNALGDALVSQDLTDAQLAAGIKHTRELTDTEVEFNAEYPDDAVSYSEKYVWVKGDRFVYAIYNTIDPTATDPYASITEEETEETEDTGCAMKFDSATFWLQFSTILLAVLLLVAVLLLIIKYIRRNHKKSVKVQSRYTVRSRNFSRVREDVEVPTEEPTTEDISTEDADAMVETAEEEATGEDTEYVYDEVIEDFGETVIDGQEVELPTEEATEEPATEEPTESSEVTE